MPRVSLNFQLSVQNRWKIVKSFNRDKPIILVNKAHSIVMTIVVMISSFKAQAQNGNGEVKGVAI